MIFMLDRVTIHTVEYFKSISSTNNLFMHSCSSQSAGNPLIYCLLILQVSFSIFFPDGTSKSGSDAKIVQIGSKLKIGNS